MPIGLSCRNQRKRRRQGRRSTSDLYSAMSRWWPPRAMHSRFRDHKLARLVGTNKETELNVFVARLDKGYSLTVRIPDFTTSLLVHIYVLSAAPIIATSWYESKLRQACPSHELVSGLRGPTTSHVKSDPKPRERIWWATYPQVFSHRPSTRAVTTLCDTVSFITHGMYCSATPRKRTVPRVARVMLGCIQNQPCIKSYKYLRVSWEAGRLSIRRSMPCIYALQRCIWYVHLLDMSIVASRLYSAGAPASTGNY